jgi:hypothetical protein
MTAKPSWSGICRSSRTRVRLEAVDSLHGLPPAVDDLHDVGVSLDERDQDLSQVGVVLDNEHATGPDTGKLFPQRRKEVGRLGGRAHDDHRHGRRPVAQVAKRPDRGGAS